MEVTESGVLLLPFAASSVGAARRRLVSDLIAAGVYGQEVGDAAVVLSELLSNALRHATPLPGATVRVGWRFEAGRVRVSVSDGGAQTRPELGQPSQFTTGGRGLQIVQKLARCWGAVSDDDGTTVWAEVAIPQLTTVSVPMVATEGS
jgi:anti-sigma regulatory factor (Ser/Thr protein kinase)